VTVSGSTRIAGILGDGISYTLSPRMHNRAFSELGIDGIYIPFDVREGALGDAVKALRGIRNFIGANVTVPYKREVVKFLDEVRPRAERAGAVNTICVKGGRLIGDNTDAEGFLRSLKEEFNPSRKTAVIVGAGGTAYAAASALAGAGVRELRVLNRTVPRARELGRHLRRHFPKCPVTVGKLGLADLNKALSGADLLVSTVQSGLEKIAGRIPKDELSRIFVYDVVYARETPLLKAARRARARRMDGLGMLAHQGALAFELWTGKTAPVAIMKKALKGK
jgi:shikimate dehydrogenase